MRSVFRSMAVVVAGFVVASVVMMIIETVNGRVFYPELARAADGMKDREAIRALLASAPVGAFLVVIAGWILGGAAGGAGDDQRRTRPRRTADTSRRREQPHGSATPLVLDREPPCPNACGVCGRTTRPGTLNGLGLKWERRAITRALNSWRESCICCPRSEARQRGPIAAICAPKAIATFPGPS